MATVTAAMLVIGDEILSGRTRDANTQTLAKALGEIGVRLSEARVVPDEEEKIVAALDALRAAYDYVFTSGGIGPTHDDITALAVGKAFGVPVGVRADARDLLEAHYGDQLNEARLRMARIPDGADLIPNPVSVAPGFRIENVFVMAGIPQVFNAMLDHALGGIEGGDRMHQVEIAAPCREGDLSKPLGKIAAAHPKVSIGSYPRITPEGGFAVTVVARATDEAALSAADRALQAMVAALPTG